MSAMMLIVWVPLLIGVVWAVRAFTQPTQPSTGPQDQTTSAPDARDLARLAYARGELDRERYLQILEDLDQARRSAVKR